MKKVWSWSWIYILAENCKKKRRGATKLSLDQYKFLASSYGWAMGGGYPHCAEKGNNRPEGCFIDSGITSSHVFYNPGGDGYDGSTPDMNSIYAHSIPKLVFLTDTVMLRGNVFDAVSRGELLVSLVMRRVLNNRLRNSC